MQLYIQKLQRLLLKRPISIKALLAIVFMAPIVFSSCSIFKPKLDNTASRYPEQIYKSQREKKPDFLVPRSSDDNPPFWYREQHINPETLLPEAESLEPLPTENQAFLPEIFSNQAHLDLLS